MSTLTPVQMFQMYRDILRELHDRKIIRTMNSPQGDYVEYLVAGAFGGRLAPNSEKSWDVEAFDSKRLQVKCRAMPDPERVGSRVTSPFRSFDFDEAVIVLLRDEDFSIGKASSLAVDVIRERSVYRSHVNGHVLRPTPAIMALGTDVTEPLRTVAEAL